MSAINQMKKELDAINFFYDERELNGAETLIIPFPLETFNITVTVGIFIREEKKIFDVFFMNIIQGDMNSSKKSRILEICNDFNIQSDYEKMYIQENNSLVIRHAGSLEGFNAYWVLGNILRTIDRLNNSYLEQILDAR
ncbi:MAG: YbjN domain-containing protein [Veillonella sp.]|jgi:hypothetical protein|nr:YbjN domain-containing protein [Veillonella sp.]